MSDGEETRQPDAAPRTGRSPEFYEVTWEPKDAPAPSEAANAGGRWLVIGPGDHLDVALRNQLQAQGQSASAIAAGSSDLLARVRATAQADGLTGVVYVPPAAEDTDQAAAAERLLLEAVAVSQALIHAGDASAARVWFVTRGATTGTSPAGAALWGFARTLALEHPRHWGGIVDVDATDEDAARTASRLTRELLHERFDDQVAFRQGVRSVARLARSSVAGSGPMRIDPRGTYLITGGLGSLGRRTAEWLADAGASSLQVNGRSHHADEQAFVDELRARGVDVTVHIADITREDEVERLLTAIRSAGRELRGIIHAAGIDRPGTLEALTENEVRLVTSAKMSGAWLLDAHTQQDPLDFFVCFSSLAAVLGSAGRAHYAAANAFLDGLAWRRASAALPALTVNWGPWLGGGMATAETLARFERVGNHGLEPAEALACLATALGSGKPSLTVAAVDWAVFLPVYAAQRRRPFVEGVGVTPEPSTATADESPWLSVLAALPADGRHAELVALLRTEAARAIGLENPADIRADADLFDVGMDSLLAADLTGRLQRRLGIRRPGLLFEHPVLDDLATALLGELNIAAPEDAGAVAGRQAAASLVHRTADVMTQAYAPAPTVAVATEAPESGVSLYTPDAAADVFDFCRRAWPARRTDWIEPRWRWMFEESARRVGVPPQVWLYRDRGRIGGHNGSIPVVAKIGSGLRSTGWLVDTMVLEEYRPRGVGAQLMVAAHEGLPFALSLGQTEQMRTIQLRLGWEQVAPLRIGQLLIRPENVFKGKLPAPAALAAGWGVRAASALRDAWAGRSDLVLQEIAQFDERHSELWRLMAGDVTCAVRRDASYLNWKYVAQPGQEFLRWDVVECGTVRGALVCMFREPDSAYKYRRAFLVDLVAPLGDASFLARLIQSVAGAVASRNADALLCYHTDGRLAQALRSCGFQMREPERYLLVRPGDLSPEERTAALSPGGWFVTHGDSDVDRPW